MAAICLRLLTDHSMLFEQTCAYVLPAARYIHWMNVLACRMGAPDPRSTRVRPLVLSRAQTGVLPAAEACSAPYLTCPFPPVGKLTLTDRYRPTIDRAGLDRHTSGTHMPVRRRQRSAHSVKHSVRELSGEAADVRPSRACTDPEIADPPLMTAPKTTSCTGLSLEFIVKSRGPRVRRLCLLLSIAQS